MPHRANAGAVLRVVRILIPLVAGGLSALGFEPWGYWPLTLLGLAALFAMIDAAPNWRAAAFSGWLFGAGHFAVGLTWIATAFTYQAKMPAAVGWVAVIGLAMFLAIYVALAAALARALPLQAMGRALAFAAMWMLGEWLRGVVLSGFAWNPLGAVWLAAPGMAFLAEFIGTLGLSALAVLAGAALWLIVQPRVRLRRRLEGVGLAVALLIAGNIGHDRNKETYYPDYPNILLVQPNIGQDVKYVEGEDAAHLQSYIDMTRAGLASEDGLVTAGAGPPADPPRTSDKAQPGDTPDATPDEPTIGEITGGSDEIAEAQAQQFANSGGGRRQTIVIWSESAVFGLVEEDAALRQRLASVLSPGDLLLFGGVAAIRDSAGNATALTNSLFVLDDKGVLHGRYDKAHLVPLGEYVPARPLMTAIGLARLAPGDIDFQPGPGPRTLKLPGAPPVGVQICYEIIFGHAVIDEVHRPAWIANISNDAWFGPSGPPQHLAQTRLRAIEEGLPIVRATPTGISAIIDARGNIIASIGQGKKATSFATLPPPLPQTLFGIFGHQTSALLGWMLLLPAFAFWRQKT